MIARRGCFGLEYQLRHYCCLSHYERLDSVAVCIGLYVFGWQT